MAIDGGGQTVHTQGELLLQQYKVVVAAAARLRRSFGKTVCERPRVAKCKNFGKLRRCTAGDKQG